MPFSQNNQSDFSDNSLPIIRETFEDKKMISKNKTSTAKNAPVEVRFVKPMGCKFDEEEEDLNSYHGRIGPAELTLWWNPSDPFERPPYTYATVIAHAILSSKTGRLTVDEIYNWIAETYPYYKLDKRGWKVNIFLYSLFLPLYPSRMY
jgi:hypothetical protein